MALTFTVDAVEVRFEVDACIVVLNVELISV